MTLFIVGTGRCGTKTLATLHQRQGHDAHHEANIETTVEVAARYAADPEGTHDAVVALLRSGFFRVGDIEADYKLSELIEPLLEARPDSAFLWLHRRPLDTVRSMVSKGWYRDDEEDYLPFTFQWWGLDDGKATMMFDVNWRAFRTTGPLVGDMTLREWRALGQAGRCAWWWQWCNMRIRDTLPAGSARMPIESVSGLRINRSKPVALSAAETRLVGEICGPLEAALYG